MQKITKSTIPIVSALKKRNTENNLNNSKILNFNLMY